MRSDAARALGTVPAALGQVAAVLRSRVVLSVAWVLVLAVSMVVGIGQRPLSEPAEAANAEIAREMLKTGDFVLPRLDQLPHLDQPPLYSALVAGSFALLGQTELAARLPCVLATLLTALLTALLARRLFGPDAALLAAGALLAAPLIWGCSQVVILEAPFMLVITASIVAFHHAVEAPGQASRSRQGASLAAWACIAVAVLTQGLMGLVLPLLTMTPYAVWRGRAGAVLHWRGALLATALAGPWIWLLSVRMPDFAHSLAVTMSWQRQTNDTLQRSKAVWYLIVMLLVWAFPWSALAVAAARRAWQGKAHEPGWVLIGLWTAMPLVCVWLSHAQLPTHVLPLMPALALLAAGLWTGARDSVLPGLRGASWAWVVTGFVCILTVMSPWMRHLPEPFQTETLALPLVGLACVAAGIVGLRAGPLAPHEAAWIVSAPLLVLYFSAQTFLVSLSDVMSTRTLARTIARAVPKDARIIGVHAYPQALPFYLQRPLEVASEDGSELASRYLSQTYAHWISASTTLHPADYWQQVLAACPRDTVFVAGAADREVRALLAARLPQLTQDARYVVFGPCRGPVAAPVEAPRAAPPNRGEKADVNRMADTRADSAATPFVAALDRDDPERHQWVMLRTTPRIIAVSGSPGGQWTGLALRALVVACFRGAGPSACRR